MSRATELCLACSSTIPLKTVDKVVRTACCNLPICIQCTDHNPRLMRYNPCLACLGGVGAVSAASSSQLVSLRRTGIGSRKKAQMVSKEDFNLDGSLRDKDIFVLGEDDDAEDVEGAEGDGADQSQAIDLASQRSALWAGTGAEKQTELKSVARELEVAIGSRDASSAAITVNGGRPLSEESETQTGPWKYYINRKDTVIGVAFKYGFDPKAVCRINNLPLSTLSTTPHLLHTRAYITLPPKSPSNSFTQTPCEASVITQSHKDREAPLARERAAKRFQTLTKEVDWRVAKTYVALASDVANSDELLSKRKESGLSAAGVTVEDLAVDQYLDDEDWEQNERDVGRRPGVSPKPPVATSAGIAEKWGIGKIFSS